MINMESLTEQLKELTAKRDETAQIFHRLTGAMQMLEGQIKSLEGDDELDELKEAVE